MASWPGPEPLLLWVSQSVHTRLKGIPYFFRMMGEMRVILWRRKASQPCELPGKKPIQERVASVFPQEEQGGLRPKVVS
jgi:hypothetical protein